MHLIDNVCYNKNVMKAVSHTLLKIVLYCYRKAHKYGIYPYYQDYDITKVLGYDEDDYGKKYDFCLDNFTCPESSQYFDFVTHECIIFFL